MKNLVLILSVAISLSILSGCGDSDSIIEPETETETPPDDDIVGYWNLTKIVKDGVDLTDDCTTRTDMTITRSNSFTGNDYDAEQNDCSLTLFGGTWVHLTDNLYTFAILGNEYIQELYVDTLKTEFIHAFDGQHYILEYIKQQ